MIQEMNHKNTLQFSLVLSKVEEFVKQYMEKNDASHDWLHVERVRTLALHIAEQESMTHKVDKQLVELAALLHDVGDFKYSGSHQTGPMIVTELLKELNYPDEKIEKIVEIVDNISFRKELGSKGKYNAQTHPEFCIVQDADRLDAIGAVGIARCFTFGASKQRKIYDPKIKPIENITQTQYNSIKDSPTINHFYEKLIHLESKLKTKTGQKIGKGRHDAMMNFLNQFETEVNFSDLTSQQ